MVVRRTNYYSAANFIYFFATLHEYGTNFEQWALSLERDSRFVTDLHADR